MQGIDTTDPAQALAAALAAEGARIPPDVRQFLRIPPASVTETTGTYPPTWCCPAGCTRRLFVVTTPGRQQATLSLWATRDGSAYGPTLLGGVRQLPGPPQPPAFTGVPPGANVRDRYRVDGLPL